MQNDDIQDIIARIDKELAENNKAIENVEKQVAETDLMYAKAVVECDIKTLEAIESIQKEEEN